MTAGQFSDAILDDQSRPSRPDWHAHPSRPRSTRRRAALGIIGEFCPPADCLHPVEARVWPVVSGYVATCHECGLSVRRNGTWEVAVP